MSNEFVIIICTFLLHANSNVPRSAITCAGPIPKGVVRLSLPYPNSASWTSPMHNDSKRLLKEVIDSGERPFWNEFHVSNLRNAGRVSMKIPANVADTNISRE